MLEWTPVGKVSEIQLVYSQPLYLISCQSQLQVTLYKALSCKSLLFYGFLLCVCSYSRNVVEFPRALQASNPEVCVQYPSKFQRDIRLLQYMTREMNSLTATCSSDDEDCIVPPTTTLYYDLDTIDLMLDVSTGATEMGSGSGSGTDGEGVCQSVVTTPPPTLPTVAVTGGSSITGGPGVGDETPTIDVGVTEVILPGGTGHSSAVCFSGVTRTLSAVLTMMITHLTITEM